MITLRVIIQISVQHGLQIMSKGHQMIKDYVSNFKILAKKTLSFGNQKFSNSIEDIKDMSSKKQKEFNEYINQQARKRVERDYKKVNKDWRDEISPSEFLVRVAKEEKIIKNKAKKRGINVALGLTGLSLLRPRALFKQLIGDDEDIDDTEV